VIDLFPHIKQVGNVHCQASTQLQVDGFGQSSERGLEGVFGGQDTQSGSDIDKVTVIRTTWLGYRYNYGKWLEISY